MRIALPVADGRLLMHFGHCREFALVDVDEATREITRLEHKTPPPHEPGVLPRWLAGQKVDLVIAGGMGQRARGLFDEAGVKVVVGAPPETVENTVRAHLDGTLATTDNMCDH